MAEVCEGEGSISRRDVLRAGLFGGALAAGGSVVFPGVAAGAERPASGRRSDGLRLTWFGTNGWKIEFQANGTERMVLFDPYLARFDTGFFRSAFDPGSPLVPAETALIERHFPTSVDHILIGHGHWDHIADVPAIQRRTNAMVIGSETHRHLLRAFGLPDQQLVIVEGGEVMAFDGYSLEVFPSLHSLGPTKKFVVPGHLLADPPEPKAVGTYPRATPSATCSPSTTDRRSSSCRRRTSPSGPSPASGPTWR